MGMLDVLTGALDVLTVTTTLYGIFVRPQRRKIPWEYVGAHLDTTTESRIAGVACAVLSAFGVVDSLSAGDSRWYTDGGVQMHPIWGGGNGGIAFPPRHPRSEEHTSELQSHS